MSDQTNNILDDITSIYNQKKEIDGYLNSHGNSNYLFTPEEYSEEFSKLYPTKNFSAIPFKRLFYVDKNGVLKENFNENDLFGFELKCHNEEENAEPDDITYFHEDDFKYLFRNNQGLSSFYIKGIFCFSHFLHTFENCRNLKHVTIDVKFLQNFERTFALGHKSVNSVKSNASSIRRTTMYGFDSSFRGSYDNLEKDVKETIKYHVDKIFDDTSFVGCESLETISFPQQSLMDLVDLEMFDQLSSVFSNASHPVMIVCKDREFKLPTDQEELNTTIEAAKELLAIDYYTDEIQTDYYRIKNHEIVGLTETGLNYFNTVFKIMFPTEIKDITLSKVVVNGWTEKTTASYKKILDEAVFEISILHSRNRVYSMSCSNRQAKLVNGQIVLGNNASASCILGFDPKNGELTLTCSDEIKYPFSIENYVPGTQYVTYNIIGGKCDFLNKKTFMDDYFDYYSNTFEGQVASKHFVIPAFWRFDFMPFEYYKNPFNLTIEFEHGTKTINTGCVIGNKWDGEIYRNFDLKKNLTLTFIIPKTVQNVSNKMVWAKIADNVTFKFLNRNMTQVKEIYGYPFVFEGTYLYHLKNKAFWGDYLTLKQYSRVHYLTINTINETWKIPVDITVNSQYPLINVNSKSEYDNVVGNNGINAIAWAHSLNDDLKKYLGFTDIEA